MEAVRTLAQVEQEIAETKAQLANVHGSETEVYARIVGYYRSVRNWNKGKRDEFDLRKMFEFDSEKQDNSTYTLTEADKGCCSCEIKNEAGIPATFEMFTRATCPNCPPVKQYMAECGLEGKSIDVDTEAGLALAAAKGVFATPTVIAYDANGNEVGRAHAVEELDQIFARQAILA